MKIEPTNVRDIFGSLAFRLLALLTIALAPIGAIAVYQNSVLSQELAQRAEDELLNETLVAVTGLRKTFERAFGAAEALASTSETLVNNPGACTRLFQRFVGTRAHYSFAGLLPQDGSITCSSFDRPMDVSGDPSLERLFADAVPFVVSVERGAVSQVPVLMIGHPVFEQGELVHFVIVSIPRRQISSGGESLNDTDAISISTYNASGQVLLTSDAIDSFTNLPSQFDLSALTLSEGRVFEDVTQTGEPRVFSAVPIFGSSVYAIASWPRDKLANPSPLAAWLFPVVMWLATLGVTYLALNRLVIRHVRTLGRQMRRFARNRTLPELRVDDDQPAELFTMASTFRAMAEEILHDEALLENSIHEKNGLIREVHHRVKNNLQLIASIMNMQIRKSRNSETSTVVRRLQDRVLGLAAIHRQMYQAQSMTEIPVDSLLDEALRQTVNLEPSGRVTYERSLARLDLNSDQAVPLALLASEATLNAVKYVSAKPGETGWINVDLSQVEGHTYKLEVANSRAPSDGTDREDESGRDTGLGTQLMRAFASQLDGRLEMEEKEDRFVMKLVFQAKDIEEEFLPTTNEDLRIKAY